MCKFLDISFLQIMSYVLRVVGETLCSSCEWGHFLSHVSSQVFLLAYIIVRTTLLCNFV